MAKDRVSRLLDEIEQASADTSISLADALRKCVILGGRAGSTQLRDWATRELKGYDTPDELPEYRKPGAVLMVEAFKGGPFTGVAKVTQQIGPHQLPDPADKHIGEEVPLVGGIGELESYRAQAKANNGSIRLSIPHAAMAVQLMNHELQVPGQQITGLFWELSEAGIAGVLDHVRTILAELVAEIRAGLSDDESTPSPALADQAVDVAVYGAKRVNINTAQAAGSGSHTVTATQGSSEGRSLWAKIGATVVGVATVGGVVVAVLQWQGWGF